MEYENATARYRRWYAKLLRFYPKQYRERFGESMEQTFNDLLRERTAAGGGLFRFLLWVFVETSTGIIREDMTIMTPTVKRQGAAIIWIITAFAIIATAYLAKGTAYENAWLLILGVGAILSGAFEMYARLKARDKP